MQDRQESEGQWNDVASHSLSAWLPRPPKAWLPRLPRPPKVLDLLKASVGVREGKQGVRDLQGFPPAPDRKSGPGTP